MEVLVVDDNRLTRELLKVILELEGHSVDEAESGFRAIEIVKLKKIDLIFMDCSMPVMDGLETCRQIKAFAPFLPVIGMSASGDLKQSDCLLAGMIAYIHKPFDREKIRAVLSSPRGPVDQLREI